MARGSDPQGLLLNLERLKASRGGYLHYGGLGYDEIKEFVTLYEDYYRERFRTCHPKISDDLFEECLEQITTLEIEDGWEINILDWYGWDILFERYKRVLQIHFTTKYCTDCDYSIRHFFSGKIRLYRFRDLERRERKMRPEELEYMKPWLNDTELNEKILSGEISDV